MNALKLTVILVLWLSALNAIGCKKISRDLYDPLMLARCDLKCWNLKKLAKNECTAHCLTSLPKPGRCAHPNEMTPWESTCIKACVRDIHCPSMNKCCQNECGATCHEPRGLNDIPGLPGIPQKITVTEKRRGRNVRVSWSSADVKDTPILYVLEERHHIGKHFSKSLLDRWTPRQRSQKPSISMKNFIKAGRWYEFRVAAVNQNGTRGFSEPSSPFTISHGPRPPSMPRDLSVSNLIYVNGSLRGEFHWKPPRSSDVPIQKYKVYWSHRLQGIDYDLNSVVVHHRTVGKDQTSFLLKDLHPYSLYFLQVQALAMFGSAKLKSDKAALIVNTTNFSNESISQYEGNGLKRSLEHRIQGLSLQKIIWTKDQLVAYITWSPDVSIPRKHIRYNIQWWTGQCEGNKKGEKANIHVAATTDMTKFALHDLNFGCKYLIRVNKIIGDIKNPHGADITFKSPTCEQVKKKLQNDALTCQ